MTPAVHNRRPFLRSGLGAHLILGSKLQNRLTLRNISGSLNCLTFSPLSKWSGFFFTWVICKVFCEKESGPQNSSVLINLFFFSGPQAKSSFIHYGSQAVFTETSPSLWIFPGLLCLFALGRHLLIYNNIQLHILLALETKCSMNNQANFTLKLSVKFVPSCFGCVWSYRTETIGVKQQQQWVGLIVKHWGHSKVMYIYFNCVPVKDFFFACHPWAELLATTSVISVS